VISEQVLKSVTHRQLKPLVVVLLETIEWKPIQYKTFWTPGRAFWLMSSEVTSIET